MTLTVGVVIVLLGFLTEVHLAENNVGTGFDHATINDGHTRNMSEDGPNQELLVEQGGKNTMTALHGKVRKREAPDCEIVDVTEKPLTTTMPPVSSQPQPSHKWMVFVPPNLASGRPYVYGHSRGYGPAWFSTYPHMGMHHQYRLPTASRWPFPPAGYQLQRPVISPQPYIAGLSHQGIFGYPQGIHGMFELMGSSEEGRG